ncbi:hypothetical protein BG000_003938 [Podila horticola]|nr:hypothetical protein BG000_003938 [Podila horticola]
MLIREGRKYNTGQLALGIERLVRKMCSEALDGGAVPGLGPAEYDPNPMVRAPMKCITLAAAVFLIALASVQAIPRPAGGGLVNLDDVKVPVNVEIKDVANHLADHAKILSR